jgi:hypothetical protein
MLEIMKLQARHPFDLRASGCQLNSDLRHGRGQDR